MGKVNLRQEKPQEGVRFTVINIPDDLDHGTGSFTSVFDNDVVEENRTVESGLVHAPAFRISVILNPVAREVQVLLGKADGAAPLSRKVYELPPEMDSKGDCNVEVDFRSWDITAVQLNNMDLEERA